MRTLAASLATAALLAGVSAVAAPAASLEKTTTSYATIGGEPAAPYSRLKLLPGWKRVVRDDLGAAPQKRRLARRRSLIYFAQLSDFQLADEESPVRAEALDLPGTPFTSAWRPQEAFEPFTVDEVIRQVNRFDQSPIRNRTRRRARMALAITTGDSADNQQINEVKWVVRLLEGGRLDPNSGVENAVCGALAGPSGEAARYTGVQDDDDVLESGRFYDPDRPSGAFGAWPSYPGLMDRAQVPFEAAGLNRPSYVALGNHDGTVQGNLHALQALDDLAKGCVKPLSLTGLAGLGALTSNPGSTVIVPPDPERGFADGPTYRALHATGRQGDAHGFAFVDAAERAASRGHASYYAFTPKRGVRMISINTVAEGDRLNSTGNLDDPQFRWLRGEIEAAERRGELIILFGHHPIGSLRNPAPDEDAGDCALRAVTGPGCDLDPRRSRPLRLGADLRALALAHPSVIAYVAGHTHENRITAMRRSGDRPGGFWAIESASEIDWPIQSRLLELMDNRDGTLSIFGTLIDHAATLATPPPGTPAASFGPEALAALGREFAYNDPQVGVEARAEGRPQDRNVELLLPDPRRR
ncbi:MAG: metallophosphoesterase [Solirubrobacteraceae bacterium]|nr:metallophosphoesterase [Solirubrobacteraceae bacterium]